MSDVDYLLPSAGDGVEVIRRDAAKIGFIPGGENSSYINLCTEVAEARY